MKIKSIEIKKGKLRNDSMPDIDLDFADHKRHEVKEYLSKKYGDENVCGVGTYSKMKIKTSLKDISRALGIGDFQTLNFLTKQISDKDESTLETLVRTATQKDGLKRFLRNNPKVLHNLELTLNTPRAMSTHASAFLILPKERGEESNLRAYDWIPVKKIDGVLVSEWEGKYIDAVGILKNDILGLNQLTKYDYMIALIKEQEGVDIDIEEIPLDDKQVYDYFKMGWNEDVFQFNSGGLKAFSKAVLPDTMEDLIAMNALFRPGPMGMKTHDKFAEIKNGKASPEYPPLLKGVVENTLGLFVYQEQIMRSFAEVGFSLIEADEVRTIMKKKDAVKMNSVKDRFIKLYVSRMVKELGYSKDDALEIANEIWDTLVKFSAYGFNKCITGDTMIYRFSGNQFQKKEVTVEWLYDSYHNPKNTYLNNKKKFDKQGHWGLLRRYNPELGKVDYGYVKCIHKNGIKKVWKIKLENSMELKLTSNHKLMMSDEKYKKLSDLKKGDELLVCGEKIKNRIYKITGLAVEKSKIISIDYVGEEMTYDVEMLDDPHNFIANGIVSHNSHSTAYSKLSYIAMWFKVYYPLQFYCTSIQLASEREIPLLLREIEEIGLDIEVVAIDINNSRDVVTCDPKTNKIFCSTSGVKGVGLAAFIDIEEKRKQVGKFDSMKHFLATVEKKKVGKGKVIPLILAGAFDIIEGLKSPSDRKELLMRYLRLIRANEVEIAKYEKMDGSEFAMIRKQKELTGIGNIDYSKVLQDIESEENMVYLTPRDFYNKVTNKYSEQMNIICGEIKYLDERPYKSKDSTFCRVVLINNNDTIEGILWDDCYSRDEVKSKLVIGDFIAMSCLVRFDDWAKKNKFFGTKNTKVWKI